MIANTTPRSWIVACRLATLMTAVRRRGGRANAIQAGVQSFLRATGSGDRPAIRGRRGAAAADPSRSIDRSLRRQDRRSVSRRSRPGAKYPYQFKVVNASDINAFALPGGYLYVNRGPHRGGARTRANWRESWRHEIAHVALRHGTSQASKAYLAQAGLGLSGRIGRQGRPLHGADDRYDRRLRTERAVSEVQPRGRGAGRRHRRADDGRGRLRPGGHGGLLRHPGERAGSQSEQSGAILQQSPRARQPRRPHQRRDRAARR